MTDSGKAQLMEDVVSSMIENLGQSPVLWTMHAMDEDKYQMFSTLDLTTHLEFLTTVLAGSEQAQTLAPWSVGADIGIVEVQETLDRWVRLQRAAEPNVVLRLVVVGPVAFQMATRSALTIPDGIQIITIGE